MNQQLSLATKFKNSYKVNQFNNLIKHVFWSTLAPAKRILLRFKLSKIPEINIHFGCGEISDARFINVDARPLPHVHLVTKSPMLRAFPKSSAHSIYGCHVFEHLPFHMQKIVITRWVDILKPGGWLRLSVPDFDKLVDKYLICDRNPLSIQAPLMGGQDYPGNFHCAIFTSAHLSKLLRDSGLINITAWHPRDEHAWPHDHSWSDSVSLNLIAQKPISIKSHSEIN